MKEHQLKHKHKRYYIAAHIKDENPRYRTSEGSWSEDFHKANLWSDYDFVVKKIKDMKSFHGNFIPQRNIVIGCVDVAVDGYFAPVTIVVAPKKPPKLKMPTIKF